MTSDDRRRWALAMIGRASGVVPAYGSREWLALPDGPERVAALVLAAERSLRHDLLDDLQAEAEHRWDQYLEQETVGSDWSARDQRHRQMWTGTGFRTDAALTADVEREWVEWVNAS